MACIGWTHWWFSCFRTTFYSLSSYIMSCNMFTPAWISFNLLYVAYTSWCGVNSVSLLQLKRLHHYLMNKWNQNRCLHWIIILDISIWKDHNNDQTLRKSIITSSDAYNWPPWGRDGRFGSKVGQIGHFPCAKCTEIWSEKAPDVSHFGAKSTIPAMGVLWFRDVSFWL